MNKTGTLKSQSQGLTSDQVLQSRQRHGSNILTPPKRDPWWKLYLEKYDDPVIRILLIAAVIALLVGLSDGHYYEGLGIMIAVLLATTLAFLNEFAANRKFDVLNQVTDEVPVKVIRNGNYITVARKDVVVGDLVMIETGEEVPADGKVVEAVSLQIDESRLTGESVPVTKKVPDANSVSDHNAAYPVDFLLRDTFVREGHALFNITAVGDKTEIGKTARAAAEDTGVQTPLNRQLDKLSKIIGIFGFSIALALYVVLVIRSAIIGELVMTSYQWYVIALLSLAVFIAIVPVWGPMVLNISELKGQSMRMPGWLPSGNIKKWLASFLIGLIVAGIGVGIGYMASLLPSDPRLWLPTGIAADLLSFFMISVTVIVVAVPEGLAMSVTLSLAYSMRKMMATNNLVRRMHACETIGAATVICTDKTGTLTRNEMLVNTAHFDLELGEMKEKPVGKAQQLIVESIAANSTAQLDRTGEKAVAIGNPTEGALLLWLEDKTVDYLAYRDQWEVEQQWPFNTERKYMATLGKSNLLNQSILYVKGAPEIILDYCQYRYNNGNIETLAELKASVEAELKDYQRRGMRTLAFAFKTELNHQKNDTSDKITDDLIWLGYVAIADPVREEVPSAIQACHKAGIQVKVVTGDVAETAREIGRSIGLLSDNEPEESTITGSAFNQMDDQQASVAAQKLKILSRARPLDKLRLVKLLQQQNHVVAVTGDGTNDAPALNHADVGLAMGKTGTAVAKEASDIVLLDDSFSSIVNAVKWGRSLYQNIQRFVLFQITINITALCIALVGPFIGVELPLTVIQMLWINLIMDTFAALALATESPSDAVLERPPRSPADFIISNAMLKQILLTAVIFFGVLLGTLIRFQADATVNARELSIFFTLFVLLQFWNLFNVKVMGRGGSVFRGLLENKAFLIIAAAIFFGQILIVQFGGAVFRTVPLALKEWLYLLIGTSAVLWIGELWRLATLFLFKHK